MSVKSVFTQNKMYISAFAIFSIVATFGLSGWGSVRNVKLAIAGEQVVATASLNEWATITDKESKTFFKLRNLGIFPIEIVSMRPSCKCFKPEVSRIIVPSLSTVSVNVVVSKPPPQELAIALVTKDGKALTCRVLEH